MKKSLLRLLAGAAFLYTFSAAAQDDRFANVTIESQPIAGSMHMLKGSGGNIGVSAGPDGILIIDDQYAPLAEKIAAALKTLANADVRYVINTHYHGDHTGGNAWFHENHDATVFAHDNVRVRLMSNEEADHASFPVVTYDKGLKFHFNDETIHVMHLPGGHTDSDSIVFIEEPNVLHTGDLFFNGMFPYIDLKGGGNVDQYIANVATMLEMIDKDTKIISGHGPAATKIDLRVFHDMIVATQKIVREMKEEGMSVDEIVATGLGEEWKPWSWRFINEEFWIKTLYE